MKREDISFYATIITAVVTVILAVLAVYEFFKKASSPERLALLGGVGALFLVLTFLLARRTRAGPRFLRLALSISMGAIRFAKQNVMLLVSLVAVCVLLVLLVQRTQDIVVAGIATGLVPAIVCLALAAVRLLAMTRPSFLGLAAARTDLWHYDFIDHFAEAEKRFPLLPGSIIEPRRNARCGEERMRAIFEHPPDDPNEYSTLTYNLTLAPGTRPLELRGFTGIMTELSEAAGPRPSQRSPENPVLFEIWINEKREYKHQKYASEWEEFSIRVPRQDILGIRFSTNCLGIAHFNWAVWGEPRLVEVTD